VRSGRRIPRRAGPWPGPPAPAESADADLALAEFYQLHYRPLVRMAALLVSDLTTAERVVQDAFAAVHSAWPGYWHWQDAGATLCLLRRLVVNRSRGRAGVLGAASGTALGWLRTGRRARPVRPRLAEHQPGETAHADEAHHGAR
jgi:DNA-directed RNA polymerase specialized sigma24 family protein